MQLPQKEQSRCHERWCDLQGVDCKSSVRAAYLASDDAFSGSAFDGRGWDVTSRRFAPTTRSPGVPAHGISGIWRTLPFGFFACGQYGSPRPTGAHNLASLTGLFRCGGFTVLCGRRLARRRLDLGLRHHARHGVRYPHVWPLEGSEEGKLPESTCTSAASRRPPSTRCTARKHPGRPWLPLSTHMQRRRRFSWAQD
jgi:hypothetical protein